MFAWLKRLFGAEEEKPLAKEIQKEMRRPTGAAEVRVSRVSSRIARKRASVPVVTRSGRVQLNQTNGFVAGAVAGAVGAALYDHLTEDNSSDYECDYDVGDCDGGDW